MLSSQRARSIGLSRTSIRVPLARRVESILHISALERSPNQPNSVFATESRED